MVRNLMEEAEKLIAKGHGGYYIQTDDGNYMSDAPTLSEATTLIKIDSSGISIVRKPL